MTQRRRARGARATRAVFILMLSALALGAWAQGKAKTMTARKAKHGPLLSDQQFFRGLDLDFQGMEAVKSAVGARDWATARKAFADYLRQRDIKTWYFSPKNPKPRGKFKENRAESAIRGKVVVQGLPYQFPGGKIDWHFDLTRARKDLAINNEWLWQLGRMHFWGDLASAYAATKDEKYARAWVAQMRSWVRECPRPAKVNNRPLSCWRTIESGIRMNYAWPNALHTFLLSKAFDDDAVMDYAKCSMEHGMYLRKFHKTAGNWMAIELEGLYTLAVTFPEFAESPAWRRYAAEQIYKQLDEQFTPDGAQVELSTGYHGTSFGRCLGIFEKAREFGYQSDLPDGYYERLEKGFDFYLHLMGPDMHLPAFNDTGGPPNAYQWLQKAAKLFPERQDFVWAASRRKKGAPPAQTSQQLPYAGYYALRPSWDRDANFLAFDAGPLGTGHWHQDMLNVVAWAYGNRLLYDCGGGTYEKSKWREYGTDTYSHNCVLIDGMAQRRRNLRYEGIPQEPFDRGFVTTDGYDYVAGTYDEPWSKEARGKVKKNPKLAKRVGAHTRRVLFAKPEVFIISDTFVPSDKAEHEMQARWNLLTVKTKQDEATGAVTTDLKSKPNLSIVPLLGDGLDVRAVVGQDKPELLGWNVGKKGKVTRATTVVQTRKGAGPQRMLTILLPLKSGEASPVKSVRATGPASARVELVDGRVWEVTASPEPDGAVAFRETGADGKVKRDVKGGN